MKDSYTMEHIKTTPRYGAYSERYDTDDPAIAELVCNLCWSYEKAEECRRVIDDEGIMVDGLHGKVQNPVQGSYKAYLQTASITLDQLKKIGQRKAGDALDAFNGVA